MNDQTPVVRVKATDALAIADRISALVPGPPRNGPVLLFIENSTCGYI